MAPRPPSLARRVAPAVALTGIGVILVNVLDRPTASGLLPAGSATAVTDASGGVQVGDGETTVAGTVPAAPTSSAAPAKAAPAKAAPTKAAPTTAAPAAPAKTAPAAPATAAPATPACGAMKSVGSTENITERRTYGTIQVTAKFLANGTLCGVSASYNVGDQRSQQIEAYVVPILNKQAKAARSANVNGVSGATAVTDAYSRSLQYAIDHKG